MPSFGEVVCLLDFACRISTREQMPYQLLSRISRISLQRPRRYVPPKEIPVEMSVVKSRFNKCLRIKKDRGGPISKRKLKGERRRKGRF